MQGCPIQGCALLAHLSFAPLPRVDLQRPGSGGVSGGNLHGGVRLSSVGEDTAAAAAWACLKLAPISLTAFTADARERKSGAPEARDSAHV